MMALSLPPRARPVVLAAALGWAVLASSTARAGDAPRDAIVVAVSPDATIDASRLRGAIGVELGVDAVAPDDARAAGARGTLRVDTGADGRHLRLSYQPRSEPVQRTVDLPGDPEATQRTIVALAGNLARNEGSELAAELRHGQASIAAPPPPRAGARDEAEIDPVALQTALDYYAEQDRHLRHALGWTALAVGATGMGLGYVIARNSPLGEGAASSDGILVGSVGTGFVAAGLVSLLVTSKLEDLAASDRQGAGAAQTTEAWVRAARWEHSARQTMGTVMVVGAGLAVAYSGFVAADDRWIVDPNARANTVVTFLAAGALYGFLSVAALATDGPTEAALHAYETSHGIPRWQLGVDDLAIAPTRGGAAATVRMTF